MKVHIGCGSVYLHGWWNLDVESPHTFLAHHRPELVEKWGTKEEAYYDRHRDKTMDRLREGPLDQEYVCDNYGDFSAIPVAYNTAEEVLCRHSFEHLSIREARQALENLDSIMKPEGILRLDVPDHNETVRLLRETGDKFYERHLLGPRRDERGFHLMSYTREMLIKLVEEFGFRYQSEEENIHFYPAFCLRFIKSKLLQPREYARPPYEIPADWRVADVGPGQQPFLRANDYIDVDEGNLHRLHAKDGRQRIHSDLMEGLPEIADKTYDYVFCSHVLEHVDDPIKCAQSLSRIGKRGTAVFPSAIKEGLFNFEEPTHKWLVLPTDTLPLFVKRNGHFNSVIDADVQRIASRLYRTGPNRSEEQQTLRNWYAANEPALDVIVHWEDKLEVQVIR